MPGNDLGFGDTFSNVGQLKQIVGHRLKPQEFASKRRPAVWGRGNIPTRRHEDMACPTPSPVRPAPPGRRSNVPEPVRQAPRRSRRSASPDRKSVGSGKSVSGRVDIGGGRIIKKKKKK